MTTEPPPLDIDRILACLTQHDVDFLLVGGVAALAYGARRPTADLDCLARRSRENLDRLAAVLRELNARLRVHGLNDDEAAQLPTNLDSETLGRMEISTWRTDAGDFDVLTDLPARDGRRLRYGDLIDRAELQDVSGIVVRVAALDDVIASKEWGQRRVVLGDLCFGHAGGQTIQDDAHRHPGPTKPRLAVEHRRVGVDEVEQILRHDRHRPTMTAQDH